MNTRQLKSLIKESVREVIKEELSEILKEAILKRNDTQELLEHNNEKQFSFTSSDVINKPQRNGNTKKLLDEMYGFNNSKSNFTSTTPGIKNPETIKNEIPEGTKSNPYLKFFADTAQNMTAQDKAALRNISNE